MTAVVTPPQGGADETSARRGPRWQLDPGKKKIKPETLMNFSRQAGSFLAAGIPLLDALRVLASDTRDQRMRVLIDGLASGIRRGATMADTLDALPVAFPPYYIPMIRAGETTGRVDEVLDRLASYLERDIDTRRKIRSAMTYPAIVTAVGLVVVLVMVTFVLPRFEVFFASIHADLPLPTRLMLSAARFRSTTGLLLLLGLLVVALAITVHLSSDSGRDRLDRTVLRIPVVGELARFVSVERFCRSLSAMLAAGTSLPLALDVAAAASGNRLFVRGLAGVRAQVMGGSSLADAIAATGLYPAAANQMIRVGEETGSIDAQLGFAADFYERELGYRLTRFTSVFESAVIIAISLVVGFVAVALVSAMFGMYSKVAQ